MRQDQMMPLMIMIVAIFAFIIGMLVGRCSEENNKRFSGGDSLPGVTIVSNTDFLMGNGAEFITKMRKQLKLISARDEPREGTCIRDKFKIYGNVYPLFLEDTLRSQMNADIFATGNVTTQVFKRFDDPKTYLQPSAEKGDLSIFIYDPQDEREKYYVQVAYMSQSQGGKELHMDGSYFDTYDEPLEEEYDTDELQRAQVLTASAVTAANILAKMIFSSVCVKGKR